ncbi:MAG: hypothetical protein MJ149_00920, partial [Clostridia bacterium]|nr:hypothetical protein [Clostridia bacterium]
VKTPDTMLKYSVDVEIDGQPYSYTDLAKMNYFAVSTTDEHNYKITSIYSEDGKPESTITFKISVKGLNYDYSSDDIFYTQTLKLRRRQIISAICLNNDDPYVDQSSVQKVIYYTDKDSAAYAGLGLKVDVAPNDIFATDTTIKYEADSGLIVGGEVDSSKHTIIAGKTLIVNFQEDATGEKTLKLSVNVEPIAGKTVTIYVKIKKVVTATKLATYQAYDEYSHALYPNNTTGLPCDPANPLFIDANKDVLSYAYVKAYYKGTQLDASSLTARITDCPTGNIAFYYTAGSTPVTTINLADSRVEKVDTRTDDAGKYDVFKIPFVSTDVATAKISVEAGNGTIDAVTTAVYLSSVNVASNYDVNISFDNDADATKCDVATGASLNLALVAGGSTKLSFQGKLNGVWTEKVLQSFSVNAVVREGYSTTVLTYTKRSNHELDLSALHFDQDSKTEILKITFEVYYKDADGIISLTSFERFVEVAVYCPISDISITGTTDIAYVNKKYNANSATVLDFVSRNYSGRNASSVITFAKINSSENITVKSVSQLKIKFGYDISTSEEVEVDLVDNDNIIIKHLLSDTILTDAEMNDLLKGKLQIKLNSEPQEHNNLRITLVAVTLNAETTVIKPVTIKFDNFERVSNVLINGTEDTPIVRESMNSNYVYMSFMGTDENTIKAHLVAEAKYSTSSSALRLNKLDYVVKRVAQNDDGSIKTDADGNIILQDLEINQRYFDVTFDYTTNLATISVKRIEVGGENISGGIYMLTIGAQDSYNDDTQEFATASSLFVSVTDGSVKNKYMLTNDNFMDIGKNEKNLNANYVLYEDIKLNSNFKPIGLVGEEVKAFNGKLYGTLESISGNAESGITKTSSRHSITYCVSQSVQTSNELYAGLFAHLGKEAELNGIDFYATIKEDKTSTTNYFDVGSGNTLNLGAVAGLNEGTIANVVVYLNLKDDNELGISNENIRDGIFNFGAVVGLNDGVIDLTNSTIIVDGVINLGSSKTSAKINLGAVAGTNQQTIKGDYVGKESLSNIEYNVINNLVVKDTSTVNGGLTYVGGVVGNNGGTIKQLVVGGHLEFVGNIYARGYMSGVSAVSTENSIVDTVAVLGLDIIKNTDKVTVAGVTATSTKSTYTNIKFVSAQVQFANAMLSLQTANGKIESAGVVAGIVAVADADTIKYCSVESFIAKVTSGGAESNFYTLKGSTVYGIAGGVEEEEFVANVSYNFVTANIDAETVWAIAPTHNNCYFIGETTADGINRSEDDSTTNYIVVIETNPTDDRVMYTYFGTSQDKTYFTLNDVTTNWESAFTTKTHFNPEREGWAWEESLNSKIVGGLTGYFTYFTIDGEPTMIIAPSQIVAKIDSEYIKEINSVYVELPESENPMEFKETEITETAIINYHYFEGDPSKSAQFNTYEITDLVDLQIVPEDADGGVNFVVVSGSSFAYLNGRKITFTGVTGNKEANRIVIKCYSIFNPDEYEYIVFHTQYGLSSLTVEATDINVSTESGIDYEISIINGADSTYIKVGAENIYKDESFRTLLNSGAESNLKDNESIDKFLQMKVEQQSDSNLVVTASDDMFGNFEIEIKEGVTDSSYENLKFTLCFNLTKYFGDAYPQVDGQDQFADLSSTMLRVNLIMSAKDIVVNNGNVEGDTQSTIPFDVDLFTGYIKDFDAEEYDVGEITPTFDGNVVKLAQEHDYINI